MPKEVQSKLTSLEVLDQLREVELGLASSTRQSQPLLDLAVAKPLELPMKVPISLLTEVEAAEAEAAVIELEIVVISAGEGVVAGVEVEDPEEVVRTHSQPASGSSPQHPTLTAAPLLPLLVVSNRPHKPRILLLNLHVSVPIVNSQVMTIRAVSSFILTNSLTINQETAVSLVLAFPGFESSRFSDSVDHSSRPWPSGSNVDLYGQEYGIGGENREEFYHEKSWI